MLAVVLIGALLVFAAAYFLYGRFLDRRFDVDDKRPTPAHTDYDGIDWVPTHSIVLFGHHFSSIAGAGPIVGPRSEERRVGEECRSRWSPYH